MSRHDDTLAAVFAEPVPANIRWRDIESLMKHHGAEITEGSGSRIRVALNGVRAVFHRPHPRPGAHRPLRAIRETISDRRGGYAAVIHTRSRQ